MTKVPFDWDVFLNNKVIVKLTSREMVKEFLSHFELIPSEIYTESMMLDLTATHDGFRFDKRAIVGHGTFRLYCNSPSGWREYLAMEYDGSVPDVCLTEVGDLL